VADETARGKAAAPNRQPTGEFNLSNPLRSFIVVLTQVVLHPSRFFAGLPRRESFLNPLLFALLCLGASNILGGLAEFVGMAGFGSLPLGIGIYQSFEALIVSTIATMLAGTISLFIAASILHELVSRMVGLPNSGYAATFRVVSYATIIGLVSWIPLVGALLALVYGFFLFIVGIREVHDTTTEKAEQVALVFPIAVFLVVALVCLIFFLWVWLLLFV
jgi:hypothetical protein